MIGILVFLAVVTVLLIAAIAIEDAREERAAELERHRTRARHPSYVRLITTRPYDWAGDTDETAS